MYLTQAINVNLINYTRLGFFPLTPHDIFVFSYCRTISACGGSDGDLRRCECESTCSLITQRLWNIKNNLCTSHRTDFIWRSFISGLWLIINFFKGTISLLRYSMCKAWDLRPEMFGTKFNATKTTVCSSYSFTSSNIAVYKTLKEWLSLSWMSILDVACHISLFKPVLLFFFFQCCRRNK